MTQDEFNNTFMDITPLNASGGTGTIFKAFHTGLKKYVILKRLEISINPAFIRREVDILKNLKHSYLPVIYNFIDLEGSFYIVEDFIEGCDLQYYIDNGISVPENIIKRWMKQLCEVLNYIHTQKIPIIHADIKPGNIMIDTNGNVCLIDFNISLMAGSTTDIIGLSKYYCSPEQRLCAYGDRTQSVDIRSDIYSLCATFYTLLSGKKPALDGKNVPLSNLRLFYSEGLCRFVDKGMHHDKKDRWQNTGAMLSKINHLETLTVKYIKTKKLVICMVAAVCVVIVTAVGLSIYISRENAGEQIRIAAENIIEEYNENNGATSEIKKKCDEFLGNNSEYVYSNPDFAAKLYAIMADYYYSSEQYGNATYYYSQAISLLEDESLASTYSEYVKRLALSQILSGELSAAEKTIENYSYIDASLITLFEIAKLYEGKDFEACINVVKGIDSSSSVYADACYFAALSYVGLFDKTGNKAYENAAKYLEISLNAEKTLYKIRMLGKIYLYIAEKSSKTSYYSKAYGLLLELPDKTDEDIVNIAHAYYGSGFYDKSIRLLENEEITDNAILCKAEYYLSLDYLALDNTEEAKKHYYLSLNAYNALSENEKNKIDKKMLDALYEKF